MRIPFGSRAARTTVAGVLAAAALMLHSGDPSHAQTGPMRWDGLLESISVSSSYFGMEPVPADRSSSMSRHSVSADARYVLFSSDATNIGFSQTALYLRDRDTGETRLLLGGAVNGAVLSADGNHLAFVACDPYMHPEAPTPICDVYAIDTRNWAWQAISATADETLGDADSLDPVISSNGRFVAFRTNATNLLAPGAALGQILLRDRDADGNGIYDEPGTSTMETVSVSLSAEPGNGPSETAEISDDGRFVAFRSSASNLVGNDTNGGWDVFLHDRTTGDTRRINARPEGQQSTSSVDSPGIAMTPDGRYVAFSSSDGLLAPGFPDDTNSTLDVFVYDALTTSLTRLDVGFGPPIAGGYVPGNGRTQWPSFSADGRYVALQSEASNTEVPNPTAVVQVYVYDRVLQKPTRVSIKPDGTNPNAGSFLPEISADGSAVLFVSPASDIMNGVPPGVDQIYAAVHMDVTPAEVFVPGRGGDGSFTVTAQSHTRWSARWDWNQYFWFGPGMMPPFGIGNGTLNFSARVANPDPAPRSVVVRVNSREVTFTQEAGLSISDVSPASGPMGGGTRVTVHGTGFEPDTRVVFGGYQSPATEFVDSTTIIATTPPHASAETVWVAVFSNDYRSAWINAAFHYGDETPPLVYPSAYGNLGENGWFTADVYVSFYVTDPDSPITSLVGCDYTVVSTDTAGTTFTCTATSEGGVTTASTTVKRDATPPGGIIRAPLKEFLYKRFTAVPTDYACSDPTSGLVSCTGPVPSGAYLDTAVPGGHYTFDVHAQDRAGFFGGMSSLYAISSAVCEARPSGLVGWWPGDGHYRDVAGGHDGIIVNGGPLFYPSPYGQAMAFVGNSYLKVLPTDTLRMNNAFTLSAWVYLVRDWLQPTSVIAGREGEYLLARGPDGNLVYSIANTNPGWGWVNTGIRLEREQWTKIALTYNGAEVRLYKNGEVVYVRTASGQIGDVAPTLNEFRIAARQDPSEPSYFDGAIDDVEVADRAMSLVEIDRAYLSADFGLCALTTTVQLTPAPQRATYGAPSATLVALLTESGSPAANEQIDFTFRGVSAGHATTDFSGRAQVTVSIAGLNAGTYAGAVQAAHPATAYRQYATTTSDLVIDKATPVVTWNTPASIDYGVPLSGTQLNATANVGGSFVYSPAAGIVLGAGSRTLSVTFHPFNQTNYLNGAADVTLAVAKAAPTVSVAGGSFTYDASAHAATGSVTGAGGAPLGPLTFTYNGSPNAPIDAGSYAVVGNYAGSADYTDASATAAITIGKATPTIAVAGGTFVYDGTGHGATGSLAGIGGAALGPLTFRYNGAAESPIDAGSYDVVGSFAGDVNYLAVSGTGSITISKATPLVSVTGGTFTYDAAARVATGSITGVDGAALGPLAFTYNGSADAPVGAGSYDVVATYGGNDNYAAASGSATITIGKATATVTVNGGTFTYDAAGHPATGSVTGVGGATLGPLTFTYNGGGEAPAAAGVYDVVGTFEGDANYLAASNASAITISKATPTVLVNGGTFAYDGASHAATGSATGVDGASLGELAFSYNGAADLPVNAGSYNAVGSYAGDANYTSVSGTATITIGKATPTVAVTGGTFTFDGAPHPATGAVTGVGGTVLGPLTFAYNGSANAPVNSDSYNVVASYAGDANDASASGTATLTIGKATPALSWTRPAAVVYGAALGSGQLNATANVAGAFSYAPAAGSVPAAGTLGLTATFTPADPANYLGGSVATTIDVAPAGLTIRANDAVKPFGTPLPVFTATYSGFVHGDTPSALSGTLGFATTATSGSPAGVYPITPGGVSSSNYAITFIAGNLSVVGGTVVMGLSTSPEPSGLDQPMTFTATVAAAPPGAGLPTGTVRFFDGATLLGSASISGGVARLTTAGLDAGSLTIEARYDGDASFTIASTIATHVVNTAEATPSVTLTSSRSSSDTGQSVTFTATVSMTSGPVAGVVQFYDGGTLIGSPTIFYGRALFTTSTLAVGSHAITARYAGAGGVPPSRSAVRVHAVNDDDSKSRSSTIALTASPNPASLGSNLDLVATVTGSQSSKPAGRVLFMMDGAAVGNPAGEVLTPLYGSNARATLTVPGLAHGRHKVSATYLGDLTYKGSTAAVTETVN